MQANIVHSMKVKTHILNVFAKVNLFTFLMLFPIKNSEEMKKLEELVSLQIKVNEVGLQDKLGEQKYHQNTRKQFEPMSEAITNTSEKLTETFTETFIKNIKAHDNLNDKILELMNGKDMIAPCLASSLVNLFKPENTRQIKLIIKDAISIRMNDFLISGGIPVSLYSKMITFRDSIKSFKLDGDLLETMTIYDSNVSHSYPEDLKLIYEFGKK